MTDQPSTSDDDRKEPPRIGIPDEFIWDHDTQAWYPPGEPSNWDQAAFSRRLDESIRERAKNNPGPILIPMPRSVLDAMDEERRSLRRGRRRRETQRDLFSGLTDDDATSPRSSAASDGEKDETEDEPA